MQTAALVVIGLGILSIVAGLALSPVPWAAFVATGVAAVAAGLFVVPVRAPQADRGRR